MAAIWVEGLGRNFGHALGLLEAAIRECPDEAWDSSMWEVVPAAGTDHAAAQRWSTPWAVAWHVLEVLDYDLTGGFTAFSPPPPFTTKAHWRDLMTLPSPWSRSDLLGYVDDCRGKVRNRLAGLTDERAATPLPQSHRDRGQPFAWVLTSIPAHTIEHSAQICQFSNGWPGA